MTGAHYGRAITIKKVFSRTTSISEMIEASPTTLWRLLTDASKFSKWNSTVLSLEGKIELGQKIKLTSTLDPNRTFKLKIKECHPNQKLIWGDAMGQRTFTLKNVGDQTLFTMVERIGGPLFPLFANKIPSFDASFEKFTLDLKNEAENKPK